MIEVNHFYSLTPEWQHLPASQMGAKILNGNTTIIPNNIGWGSYYFTPVVQGISVLLIDATFTSEIVVNRIKSDHDLYILHFDISDQANPVILNDKVKAADSYKFEAGFIVLHTSVGNSFRPKLGQRTFALRILIDSKTLEDYIIRKDSKCTNIKKKILFYNQINSNNKILLNSIKEKPINNLEFDSYLKGTALKILANFIGAYTNTDKTGITNIEIEGLENTRSYLSNHLYDNFPTILYLSKIAGMSVTKYKIIFKKYYSITPNQLFIKEKLGLANTLLKSGTFSSQAEIRTLLNYTNSKYFNNKYTNQFGRKPSNDFIKKHM